MRICYTLLTFLFLIACDSSNIPGYKVDHRFGYHPGPETPPTLSITPISTLLLENYNLHDSSFSPHARNLLYELLFINHKVGNKGRNINFVNVKSKINLAKLRILKPDSLRNEFFTEEFRLRADTIIIQKSVFEEYLDISNLVAGKLSLTENNFENLHIYNSDILTLEMANNTFNQTAITGNNLATLDISCSDNGSTDQEVIVYFNKIRHFYFNIDGYNLKPLYLYSDSIDECIIGNGWNNKNGNLKALFYKVHFNETLRIGGTMTSSIHLSDCSFGEPTQMFLSVDTLVISDLSPSETLTLGSYSEKKTLIRINNCDISKIELDFLNFELLPDSVYEKANQTYLYLLEQFRKTNKINKHQQLDIEYKNYLSQKGSRWQRFILPLSKVWWNYGYSLERIVYWTFGFLIVFYILNIWQWKKLQAVYPSEFTYLNAVVYY
ncbi:MAG: hypothetical protein WCF67_01960, partial [Chitinophagaceae bacterium]